MTVRDNMAFSLRNVYVNETGIARSVARAWQMLELDAPSNANRCIGAGRVGAALGLIFMLIYD
jgi:hypothetical protein